MTADEIAQKYQNGEMTINQARIALGLPRLEEAERVQAMLDEGRRQIRSRLAELGLLTGREWKER